MRIHSNSFEPGQPIPASYAVGTPDGFGGNRNPHLAWDDVPAGTIGGHVALSSALTRRPCLPATRRSARASCAPAP